VRDRELVMSCAAAGRGVSSPATAGRYNPTRLSEDVVGGSVPLPHGGTLGKIT